MQHFSEIQWPAIFIKNSLLNFWYNKEVYLDYMWINFQFCKKIRKVFPSKFEKYPRHKKIRNQFLAVTQKVSKLHKKQCQCYFRSFFTIFWTFFLWPPGSFCADAVALASLCYASECLINIRLTSYSNFMTTKIRLTFNPKLYGNFYA